jgi:hypothetical protein
MLEDVAIGRPRQDLGTETVDGELIVLDKQNGKVHQLNRTASQVFVRMTDGASRGTIIKELTGTYDVPEEMAKRDVDRITSQFRELQLLEL